MMLSKITEKRYAEIDKRINNKRKPTFSDNVIKFCNERIENEEGLRESDIYNKYLINRDLFSKIISHKDYVTTKKTALVFSVALHLDLDQTKELLESAGFALSDSIITDIVVKYFIEQGIYNPIQINNALVYFDQKPIFDYVLRKSTLE